MNKLFPFALVFALGCGSATPVEDDGRGARSSGAEDTSSTAAQRLVDIEGTANGRCSLETVYFQFDSSELTSASRDAVQNAVTCLTRTGRDARLHITGATDPQGTEEYNLALGERRAQSVRTYLASLGVEAGRMSTMSVGEEMATGEDEGGWARDRHAATRVDQ